MHCTRISTHRTALAGPANAPAGRARQILHGLLFTMWPAIAIACSAGGMGQTRLLDSDQASSDRPPSVQGPLAVGASITPKIDVTIPGSGAPSMSFVSMRPEVLAAEDHQLTGKAPGVSAVLITTEDGHALDFLHLWVVQPSHITLHALDSERRRRGAIDDTIEMVVGDALNVTPVIYAGNQELAGTAQATWSIDQPVAHVLRDGARERRRLVAKAPGRAVVAVEILGLKSSFDVVVVAQ